VADDSVNREQGKINSRGEPKLSAQVKMWPTPVASDQKARATDAVTARRRALGKQISLEPEVKETFATPTAADGTGGPGRGDKREGGDNFRTQAGGQLNPDWVELLMGWPKGWTSLDPLDAQEFTRWVEAHAKGTVWEPEEWEAGTPRIATGTVKRVDRLRCIGNGQVPACAALAVETLTNAK
jgi:hypothetical protein